MCPHLVHGTVYDALHLRLLSTIRIKKEMLDYVLHIGYLNQCVAPPSRSLNEFSFTQLNSGIGVPW
jgi:hypothetical protein